MSEFLFSEVWESLSDGDVVPFFGAGASVGLRRDRKHTWPDDEQLLFPFASELAAEILKWMELPADPWADLPAVAHHFESKMGRARLNRRLHDIFACDRPLRSIHERIASLERLRLVITTNYDLLIESALLAAGRPFDLVVQTVDRGNELLFKPYRGAPELMKKKKLEAKLADPPRTIVYKLHGSVAPPQSGDDEFLITDRDYLDFLLDMPRKKPFPAPIGKILGSSHLLFIGYGLRDWNVRLLLARVRQIHERGKRLKYQWWAIDERPSDYERAFWTEQGVSIVGMPLDAFAERLVSDP